MSVIGKTGVKYMFTYLLIHIDLHKLERSTLAGLYVLCMHTGGKPIAK